MSSSNKEQCTYLACVGQARGGQTKLRAICRVVVTQCLIYEKMNAAPPAPQSECQPLLLSSITFPPFLSFSMSNVIVR